MSKHTALTPTARTTLKRLPVRGSHELEQIYSILDEGMVCHVAFVADGKPVVMPTAYGRKDDVIYLHGAVAGRMARALATGIELCVTVTLVDGLVLARSAFHHSMNYRSVVVFGQATLVQDEARKFEAMRVLTEHLVPGRWETIRTPTSAELAGTLVLEVPILEASAKVRVGPPVDDEADYELPVWAGVVPLALVPGRPVADPRLAPEVRTPLHVNAFVGSDA
jgi:nitroimidazol reductase NimA-like FMN-containing flavoprotein (pyridoxamine 5'-phosphate oxidase superfamily)